MTDKNKPELVPLRSFTNTATKGRYDGAELRPIVGRPGATDALSLPSRIANRLHYRDGKVTPV